ncbi:unnamed protein product [Dicrocoelium dendriticum]|nr:unnamed protein product [Dicrocoelium dendriticum]
MTFSGVGLLLFFHHALGLGELNSQNSLGYPNVFRSLLNVNPQGITDHIITQQNSSELPNENGGQLSRQQPSVSSPAFSRCFLRPITWANYSHGTLIILNKSQADTLFDSSKTKRSSGVKTLTSPPASQNLDGTQHYLLKFQQVDCYLLFIYSMKCPFSIAAFPYVKALARAYPQLFVYAVQVEDYVMHRWSLRMLFVPKLKLIVDGRIFREYSGSDTNLDQMIDFVWLTIRQPPKGPIGIVPDDYKGSPGPLQSSANLFLIFSWVVTILSLLYLVFAFGSISSARLSATLYRISRGRYGRPIFSDSQTIQSWDPGQITATS